MMQRLNHENYKVTSAACGSPVRTTFARRTTEYGDTFLVETGFVNVRDLIQSFAEECDINNIVNRYACGDSSILQKKQGFYADVTGYPQNLADIFKSLADSRSIFDRLPDGIKSRFNDFSDFAGHFIDESGMKQVNEIFSQYLRSSSNVSKSNPKDEGGAS